MRSSDDQNSKLEGGSSKEVRSSKPEVPASCGKVVSVWNSRVHYYLGLYLLFFLWLFALSGLLLNHQWKFSEFWANRKQSTFEKEIRVTLGGGDGRLGEASLPGDVGRAKEIIRELGIHGEIDWTSGGADGRHLNFRVSRPGNIYEVKADLEKGRATVQRIELNGWGVFRILHTFTGVRMDDERNRRDWVATSMWAFAMDAVAAGIVVLALTSVVMWWELGTKRRVGGFVALGLGVAVCAWFCWGLRWLY